MYLRYFKHLYLKTRTSILRFIFTDFSFLFPVNFPIKSHAVHFYTHTVQCMEYAVIFWWLCKSLYVHLFQHRILVCISPASTRRRRRSGIGRPWKRISDHSQWRKFNISLCPQSCTSSSLNPWRRRVPLCFWSRSRVSRAEDASLLLPVSVGSCIPDGARVSWRKRETFHHSFPTGPSLAQSELLLEASAGDVTFTPSHSNKRWGARSDGALSSPVTKKSAPLFSIRICGRRHGRGGDNERWGNILFRGAV